jgi:hypothetical protein
MASGRLGGKRPQSPMAFVIVPLAIMQIGLFMGLGVVIDETTTL